MWAQLIKSRAKPGKEEEIRNLPQEFEAQGDTMPFRQIFTCANQQDPSEYYTFIVFESEEAARQNEGSAEQAKRVERLQELYDGQPEFVDLNVLYHRSQ
jgi:heme-degrading monooxygenase HmoA